MSDIDITLYVNEYRLAALENVLAGQDCSIEGMLRKAFEERYESLVPEEKREEIETLIQQEEAEEQRRTEAARRFAVIHFHAGEDDVHFTSDLRNSFYSAAYRYQNFLQEDVGKLPLDCLADCYGEHQTIDALAFSALCDAMEQDARITALLEFDFDEGTVSVKEQDDLEWRGYRLKDVSAAVCRAESDPIISLRAKAMVFEEALRDRELVLRAEVPAEGMTL